MKSLLTITVLGALGLAVIIPASALAASTTSSCYASAGLTQGAKATTVAEFIALGNCEIQLRDTTLGNDTARISQMKNVSATEQTSLTSLVQGAQGQLSTIQAKLAADTVVTQARLDYRSIFNSVRVYALIDPKTFLEGGSDRVTTIDAQLTQIENELQQVNNDSAANAALFADATAKLAGATSQANTTMSTVSPLMPDNGNATVFASNTAAIKAARADLSTARIDLQGAEKDLKQIRATTHFTATTGATASTTL